MSELDKTLGIRPLAEVQEKKTEVAELKKNATTDEDLDFVKENIHGLINNGNEAMAELLMYAKQTESPRAFEVVSGLIKTLLDANKDYMDLAIKRDEMQNKGKDGDGGPSTVNNNLIVSTDDILERLLEKKEKQKNDKSE